MACLVRESSPRVFLVTEGTAHGLLLVRSVSGETVRHGDFLQTAHGDRVESRLILRFKDGSLHDEKVTFSQQRVFTMLSYRLVQRGPSFPETVKPRSIGRREATRCGRRGVVGKTRPAGALSCRPMCITGWH